MTYPLAKFVDFLKGKMFSEEQRKILRNIRLSLRTKTKNEELAESLGLNQKDVETVVNCSMGQFVNYLCERKFSDIEANILRDIRSVCSIFNPFRTQFIC